MMVPSLIDIAVRAYTVPRSQSESEPKTAAENGEAGGDEKRRKRRRSANLYLPVFIPDTETRVTPALELMIGAYRLCAWRGKQRKRLICLEEGIIHADDLTAEEMEIVRRYWRSQLLDTAAVEPDIDATPVLRLRSESEIRKMIYAGTYRPDKRRRFVLVGQNIDFDISRFALDWAPASAKIRGTGRWSRFQGGFSLRLHEGYENDDDGWRESLFRPRYVFKHLSSTKRFRGWRAKFDNPPIDLRQLGFALTGKGHSLESGCEAFGVPYQKADVTYGEVSEELLTYCRKDVGASQDWFEAMVLE